MLLKVKQPSNGNVMIACFVMQSLHKITCAESLNKGCFTYSQCLDTFNVELEEGRWVWIGVFTQHSHWYGGNCIYSTSWIKERQNGRVERGFVATVEENRVREVLLKLLQPMGI